jgi:lysine 6-dehydrogenase
VGPLFYQTVYLLDSVFNAYRREALITRAGEPLRVPPLSGLEEVDFEEPIGALEAFYSDGLGSLPLTVARQVRGELSEKTLRYPGHVERIELLEECGLLSDRPLETRSGVSVAPLDVLLAALREKLVLGPEGDFLAMRVIVEGRRDGGTVRHVFELVDYFDPGRGETAMARTTGFTGASAARWIAGGKLTETGVLFPEELFREARYGALAAELAEKGIRITHHEC